MDAAADPSRGGGARGARHGVRATSSCCPARETVFLASNAPLERDVEVLAARFRRADPPTQAGERRLADLALRERPHGAGGATICGTPAYPPIATAGRPATRTRSCSTSRAMAVDVFPGRGSVAVAGTWRGCSCRRAGALAARAATGVARGIRGMRGDGPGDRDRAARPDRARRALPGPRAAADAVHGRTRGGCAGGQRYARASGWRWPSCRGARGLELRAGLRPRPWEPRGCSSAARRCW